MKNELVWQTIIFAIVITVIDIPWISLVMSKLYKTVFPIKLNYLAAVLAYICMIVTYPLIIAKNDNLKDKLCTALVLGLVIYGTYGFTLAAVYGKYPLTTALAETLWGMTLFTVTTYLTHLISEKLLA
jgi:uncharacterized membrane protein